MSSRFLTRFAFATLSAAVLAALPACTHTDIAHQSFKRHVRDIPVEIAGESPEVGASIGLAIHNHAGSVIVEVDDRLDAPVIEAGLLRPADQKRGSMPDDDASGIVTASYERAGDGPMRAATLRIESSLDASYPSGSRVALRVRMPRCDGIDIVNNGGPIVIIGADGAVTAQNGVVTGVGGRIEYRTSRPLRDPVALVTTRGRISAVIDPGGSGRFELDTEHGQVSFNSSYGRQTDVSPGIHSYRGTWNGGRTPFVARSADGDIDVFVKPDAEEYSTADDWMALLFD